MDSLEFTFSVELATTLEGNIKINIVTIITKDITFLLFISPTPLKFLNTMSSI